MSETKQNNNTSKFKFKMPSKKVLIIGGAIAIVALTLFVLIKPNNIAKVNGTSISRKAYLKELEKSAGDVVLDNMIAEILIKEQAKQQKVSIDKAALENEISEIEKNLQSQGSTLEEALEQNSITRKDLEKQIELRKLVEKMIDYDVTVTNDEITQYIDANKTNYEEQEVDYQTDEFKAQIKTLLESMKTQMLSQKIDEFVKGLREQAKITKY